MMIKRISAISVVILLFTFLANSRSQKQEEGSKGIRTTIVVSRQSVLPYESLSVALLLRNETTEDKRVVASADPDTGSVKARFLLLAGKRKLKLKLCTITYFVRLIAMSVRSSPSNLPPVKVCNSCLHSEMIESV